MASDSTLGGHLDDAEQVFDAPIVSISVGNTGVFLLGGKTKDEPPIAMFLRSGSVVFMGGDSRLCYHGNSLLRACVPSYKFQECPGSWLTPSRPRSFQSIGRTNA